MPRRFFLDKAGQKRYNERKYLFLRRYSMYNEWSLDIFYKGMDDPALASDMAKLE